MVNIVSGGNNNSLKINTNISGPSNNYGTIIKVSDYSNKKTDQDKYINNEVEEYDFSEYDSDRSYIGSGFLKNSNINLFLSSSNVSKLSTSSNVIRISSNSNIISNNHNPYGIQSSSNVSKLSTSSNVIRISSNSNIIINNHNPYGIQSSSNVSNLSTSSNVIRISSNSNIIGANYTPYVIPSNSNVSNFNKETIGINSGSKYSNTEHSDLDNININQLRTIMVSFKNILDNVDARYYEFFCKYCEGKKLSDIIDENGFIKLIDVTNNQYNFSNYKNDIIVEYDSRFINKTYSEYDIMLNKCISDINEIIKSSSNKLKITGLGSEILNSTIEEVVFSESGYDAFVLKHPNGNYMIVNSSTNSESIEDLAAILYPLVLNVFGDTELLDLIFNNIIVNMDIKGISDEFLSIISNDKIGAYCERIYNNQISDCASLINKYMSAAKEGQQLELYGFSLGGGIMATAYQKIVDKIGNVNNINSVTIYNPFMLYAQECSEINFTELKNDDKFLIYSAKQDLVSLFYDNVEDFLGKTVYIEAGEIEPINIKNFSFKEIYEIIIGKSGNHGFINIDENFFDESGNLQDQTDFLGINDLIISILKENTLVKSDFILNYIFKDKYNVDKGFLISCIFNTNILNSFVSEDINVPKDIMGEIADYFGKNYGNYNYDGLSDLLASVITDVVADEIEPKLYDLVYSSAYSMVSSTLDYIPFLSNKTIESWSSSITSDITSIACDVIMDLFDSSSFENAIYKTLIEKKDLVEIIISLRISNNPKEYNNEIEKLITNLEETFIELIDDEMEKKLEETGINVFGHRFNTLFSSSKYLISNAINKKIIEKVIPELKKQLQM